MGIKAIDIVVTYMDGQKARIDKGVIGLGTESLPIIEIVVGMNQHYIFPLANVRSFSFKEDKSDSANSTGRYPWSK